MNHRHSECGDAAVPRPPLSYEIIPWETVLMDSHHLEEVPPEACSERIPSRNVPLHEMVLRSIIANNWNKLQFVAVCTLLFVACHAAVLSIWVRENNPGYKHKEFFIILAWATGPLSICLLAELILRVRRQEPNIDYDPTKPDPADSTAPPSTKVRIYQLDYLKLLVNICVCLHHHWAVHRPDDKDASEWFKEWRKNFGLVIEPWLMQSISFASGFGHSHVFSAHRGRQWIRLVVGFVLVQTLYAVVIRNTDHENNGAYDTWDGIMARVAITPYYHMWYIWSLFMWRLGGHYWMRLSCPFTVSVLLALFSGLFDCCDGMVGDFRRTNSLFPYFVLGLMLKRDTYSTRLLLELIGDPVIKCWSVLMIGLTIWAGLYDSDSGNFMQAGNLFTGNWNYPQGKEIPFMFERICVYPIGFIDILCITAVMPNWDSVIRRAGTRTLGPYVLHLMIKILIYNTWAPDLAYDWKPQDVIPCFMLYWGCIFILYLPQTHRWTQYLLIPPLEWMGVFKKEVE